MKGNLSLAALLSLVFVASSFAMETEVLSEVGALVRPVPVKVVKQVASSAVQAVEKAAQVADQTVTQATGLMSRLNGAWASAQSSVKGGLNSAVEKSASVFNTARATVEAEATNLKAYAQTQYQTASDKAVLAYNAARNADYKAMGVNAYNAVRNADYKAIGTNVTNYAIEYPLVAAGTVLCAVAVVNAVRTVKNTNGSCMQKLQAMLKNQAVHVPAFFGAASIILTYNQ